MSNKVGIIQRFRKERARRAALAQMTPKLPVVSLYRDPRHWDIPSVGHLKGNVSRYCDFWGVNDKPELLQRIGVALEFPDWGMNWDAFIDFAGDMEWRPFSHDFCLVVKNAGPVWDKHPALMGEFVACWNIVATRWDQRGKSFRIAFEI